MMLSRFWARLRAILGRSAPSRPTASIESAVDEDTATRTRSALRFGDLDLDDPGEALRALRRASRTPPHQRHLGQSVDEQLAAYSPPEADEPPDLKVVGGKTAA